MKKRNITKLAGSLIWLPFTCLPLMGQTAVGNEAQAGKPFAETRPAEADSREPGSLQLRADARAWPDSTVTFTAAGERQNKTVYTYDAAGNLTSYESSRREGNAWVNTFRYEYGYDAAGHETLSEGYRWTGNTWTGTSKRVYEYDAAGHQTLSEYYLWDGDGAQWIGNSKSAYAYDDRGVLILETQFNRTNDKWVKSSEYHNDRKNVNAKTWIQTGVWYNEDGSTWGTALFVQGSGLNNGLTITDDQKMEFTATYDANDNVTLVETTWLIDGERVPHERYTVEYDSNSNPVSIEVYYYNGNDIDQMNRKAFQAYDARGNLTLSESYLWSWDSETEEIKWMGYGKQVSTYDANGNRLSDEYYDWDTSSDNWIGSYKNVYTYDANGDESSYEYYRWDTSSGGWAGGSRTTYEERNAYGDVILYHNYSWANNGWDWSTYTVYYPGGSDPNATAHVGGGEASAYIHGGVLHIRTARPERIGIYSLDGAKVYESAVPAGATTLSADRLPQGVLIVRGASGWVRKVVK